MVIQEFDLNIIPDSEPVVVHVNQYDYGNGRLVAHLYKDGTAYSPSGATARIEGRKPDGNVFSYNASMSGGTVTANVYTQMTAVAGRVYTQIVVTESTGQAGTFAFWIDVQRAAIDENAPVSATEIPAIVEGAEGQARRAESASETAVEAASEAESSKVKSAESATEAGRYSEESEAWAVGQRGGVDVPDTDETHENNSKHYAAAAERYAGSAEDSSEASSEYSEESEAWAVGQRGGVDVPDTDETHENNSKYYAERASERSSRAAQSEAGALSSERSAALHADSASTSEEQARHWAEQAAASAARGGHTILDGEGVAMTARTKLKFMDSLAVDDENGDTTVVYPALLTSYMALNNDFFAVLTDDGGNPVITENGDAILVDWKYKYA